jgi:hypothetical protein
MPTYERLEAKYLLVFFCYTDPLYRPAIASDAELRVLG